LNSDDEEYKITNSKIPYQQEYSGTVPAKNLEIKVENGRH